MPEFNWHPWNIKINNSLSSFRNFFIAFDYKHLYIDIRFEVTTALYTYIIYWTKSFRTISILYIIIQNVIAVYFDFFFKLIATEQITKTLKFHPFSFTFIYKNRLRYQKIL